MPFTPSNPLPARKIVWLLAAAEIINWASLFYIFPALLAVWERELGWSKAELSGAFTLALLTAALCAPIAGRFIDRGKAPIVLPGCVLLGATGLLALSQVTQIWQFYAVWLVMGIAMAGGLYEACFAFVTHIFGAESKRIITVIALVAGLAGTVSFPSANALTEVIGWRGALVVFAVAVACISAPLMWIASSRAAPAKPEPQAQIQPTQGSHLGRVLHMPVFWLLGFAFSMIALAHSVILTHLLPLLEDRGIHKETAVLAAAMIGPMQVTGRLLMMVIERHTSIALIASLSYVLMALAALMLFGVAAAATLIVGFVVLHGAGYGVTSITRPVVVAEFLGRDGFGAISGSLAIPFMGLFAAGPLIAALIWQVGGYDLVIGAAFMASICGLTSFLSAAYLTKRRSADH